MSSSSNRQSGEDNVGTLMRRMTLANLGLDDLDGVDDEGRAVLRGADRFAAEMDRHVGRLDHVGAQLRVLPGMPEFMVHVQERYVPLHVDTDFGMAVAETDGPRAHTDVGAWYRLLDAIHLVLFDDEEGDYVVKARGVSRSAVQKAAVAMARRGERPRSLFEQTSAVQAQTAPVAGQPGLAARATHRNDYLSLSSAASASIFGRGSQQQRTHEAPTAGREWLSTSAWDDVGDVTAGLPGGRAFERAGLAGSIGRRREMQAGANAQFTRPDLVSPVGTSLLGSLRSVRPMGGTTRRGVGASIGYAVEGRARTMRATAQLADDSDPRADATSFDPRVGHVGDRASSLAELAGLQREGYHYMGTSSGSLLAMVPEDGTPAALDALYRGARREQPGRVRPADTSGHTVSAYPTAMGRAGAVMQRLVEPVGAYASIDSLVSGQGQTVRRDGFPSASARLARPTSAIDDVRSRLLSFAQMPGASGMWLQALADEPTVRLAAAVSSAARDREPALGGRRHRRDRGRLFDAILEREPSLPSSLGFESRDLLAPFEGELAQRVSARLNNGQLYRHRFMEHAIDGAEPVRRVDVDGVERESTRHRDALQRAASVAVPLGLIERSAQRAVIGERSVALATQHAASTRVGMRHDSDESFVAGGATASRGSAVYGDLEVSGAHLRGLTSGLQAVVRSFDRATRMAAGGQTVVAIEALGSSSEETTYARLDRMLSLVRAGGVETAELREAVDALRRAGEVARTSRLAWMGDDPVLLATSSERESGRDGRAGRQVTAHRLRGLVESGLRPEVAAQAQRAGVPVIASGDVAPQSRQDGALARRMDRFADLARMFSLPHAARLLVPELTDASSPVVTDMLRESLRGELRRQHERRESLASSRPTPAFARTESVAQALGRTTPQSFDQATSADLAMFGLAGAPHARATVAGGRGDIGASATRWASLGASMSAVDRRGDVARLEVRTGFGGVMFDHERVAVTMQRESSRTAQGTLRVSTPSRAASASLAGAHGGRGETSQLGVHLSVPTAESTPGGLGVNAARAERFEPRVLGLARFEERVAAELGEARGDAPRLLRGFDDEPRTIRIFGEDGEMVRVSYGPEVLARMVAAESRRRAVLDTVTMSDVAAGRLDESQRREVARSLLGAGRVEMFERLVGGTLTSVDPARVMEAVDSSRRRSVPIEQLQAVLREALGSPSVSRTRIASELQRRISGLDLTSGGAASAPRAKALGLAYREIEQAMDRFGEASASRESRRPGYFGSLVPSGFDASAPSRSLAAAYDAPMHEMLRIRGQAGRGRELRLPIETLRLSAAQRDGGAAGRPLRLGDAALAPGSSYEVVRASGLSRVLGRFAGEGSTAGGRARFESLRGEPGELGGTLERFKPTVASRGRSTVFSAQQAMLEPVLAHRAGQRTGGAHGLGRRGGLEAASAVSRPSVAEALDVLQSSASSTLLGALGEQVVSRMAERGAPVAYVEASAGLTESEVRAMFDIGAGPSAQTRAGRHDRTKMLGRIEDFLVRARSVSERSSGLGGSPGALAAVARHLEPSARSDRGLPAWSTPDEKVKGVALGELREMLRQVGATPVQGGQTASERALVDPSGGAGQRQASQPAPLFSARDETMPSNQVRNREQAQRTSDTGKPSAVDLEIFARAVYDLIQEKLRDQLFRARST